MRMNSRYVLVLIPITLVVVGQSLAKIGASHIDLDSFSISQAFNIFITIAFVLLLIRGLVWLILMRAFDLAFIYPFMSVSYILILVVSYLAFNEVVTAGKIAGSCLIASGVFCISLAERHNKLRDRISV